MFCQKVPFVLGKSEQYEVEMDIANKTMKLRNKQMNTKCVTKMVSQVLLYLQFMMSSSESFRSCWVVCKTCGFERAKL